MSTVAAIHLITANSQIGSDVLAASVLIFGDKKAREDFVVEDWETRLTHYGDKLFAESNANHIRFLINAGAEVIPSSMITSRILGCQARHLCEGTVWQNHYESHVSHYAYLFALTGQKRDVMLKGFNMDGLCLNAANRFIAETDRNYPTGASSPEAGLMYLKELYIHAKRFCGHDIDSDGAKILKEKAPSVAALTLPPLPVAEKPMTSLTLPPLPTKVTSLPPLPGK